MNGNFSTEHWKNEDKPMTDQVKSEIIDVAGAMEMMGVTRATLWRWESVELLKSFKTVYNGKLRKCFYVSELEKLAGQGDPVST